MHIVLAMVQWFLAYSFGFLIQNSNSGQYSPAAFHHCGKFTGRYSIIFASCVHVMNPAIQKNRHEGFAIFSGMRPAIVSNFVHHSFSNSNENRKNLHTGAWMLTKLWMWQFFDRFRERRVPVWCLEGCPAIFEIHLTPAENRISFFFPFRDIRWSVKVSW